MKKRNASNEFSAQQYAYMVAKATMDALYAEYDKLTESLDFDNAWESVREVAREIRERLGLEAAHARLAAAEDALIDWGVGRALAIAQTAEQRDLLNSLKDRAVVRKQRVARQRVIELTMRLR